MILNSIKRILGFIGFKYCTNCGRKLVYLATEYRGYYYQVEIYECPHCDHLDRFNMEGFNHNEGKSK